MIPVLLVGVRVRSAASRGQKQHHHGDYSVKNEGGSGWLPHCCTQVGRKGYTCADFACSISYFTAKYAVKSCKQPLPLQPGQSQAAGKGAKADPRGSRRGPGGLRCRHCGETEETAVGSLVSTAAGEGQLAIPARFGDSQPRGCLTISPSLFQQGKGVVWSCGLGVDGSSMNCSISLFLSCQSQQLVPDLTRQGQRFNYNVVYVCMVFSAVVSTSAFL